MIHLPMIPTVSDPLKMASLRYMTVHFGPVFPPTTRIGEGWWKQPIDGHDAAGYVVGARSGLKIPLHDQAAGVYGTDSKDFAGSGTEFADNGGDEFWPF